MADDTTFDPEENDRIIAELAESFDIAPEPGDKVGHIEHRGNDEAPLPVVLTKQESAGYVYIYDRYTGDRSLTNRNMLPIQLKKRYIDGPHKGDLVFTRIDPKIPVKRNALKCRLHADDPDRAVWDEMGFPFCPKSNLVSTYHLNRHMAGKHREEWAAINDMEYQREQEEDKEFRRLLMSQAAKAGVSVPESSVRPRKNPNRVAAGKRTAEKLAAQKATA